MKNTNLKAMPLAFYYEANPHRMFAIEGGDWVFVPNKAKLVLVKTESGAVAQGLKFYLPKIKEEVVIFKTWNGNTKINAQYIAVSAKTLVKEGFQILR